MSSPAFINQYIGAFREFQQAVRSKGTYRDVYSASGESCGPLINVQGIGEILTLTSLGYLGISDCVEMKQAIAENALRYSSGSTSSRTIMDYDLHKILENELANFKRSETCLLLNTGYAASNYLTELLIGEFRAGYDTMPNKPKSIVFVDRLTHISLLEALTYIRRRDKVLVRKYDHLNYEMLEEELYATREKDGVRFILSDAIFSMNGSVADVKELLRLAKKYEAFIVLDNAHSDGCYGPQGRGLTELNGIVSEKDLGYFFQAGTLSKAFALLGGYITLPYCMSDLARVSCLKYVFSVASSPADSANAISALQIIRGIEGDIRRSRLEENATFMLGKLKEGEFNTLNSSSHIIPVVVGEEQKCLAAQQYLMENHKILIGAVRFPAVEEGGALLRVSVTASHTREQLERFYSAIVDTRRKFSF